MLESMQYERIRNSTILFFFEKLIEKGSPRTLHDLSCQFGSKEFTKEMRQIAGGSQSGLKQFLSHYPSLFTVEGDQVHISYSVSTDVGCERGKENSNSRDFILDTVNYFKNKLVQYGAGTDVPIKFLLGHRSQAPSEVRHIAGQNPKEFTNFLLRYPEVFLVEGDNVLLTEYANEKRQTYSDNVARETVREVVTREKPGDVFAHGKARDVVTQEKPPEVFAREKVREIVFREKMEEVVTRKISLEVGNRGNAPVTVAQEERPEVNSDLLNYWKKEMELRGSLTPDKLYKLSVAKFGSEHFKIANSNDLLAILSTFPNLFSIENGEISLNKNSNVKWPLEKKYLNGDAKRDFSPLQPPQDTISIHQSRTNEPESLKQRISSVLMKTLAENMERPPRNVLKKNSYVDSQSHSADTWRASLFYSTKTIVNAKESQNVIDSILKNSAEKIIGLDCEGINIGPSGQITLIQISLPNGRVFIFDLITCPQLMKSESVFKLFESDDIVKVIFDCRNICANIFNQFGFTLKNVFDLQAAYSVLHFQETGKPVYKAKPISLDALIELYSSCYIPIRDQKIFNNRDVKFWGRRPLSRDMILHAATTVAITAPYIYAKMRSRISPENELLLKELCEEQVYCHIRGDEVKQRKKQRKINYEIDELKEKLARSNRNIVLSNREIRLLKYIELTDDDKEKLKTSFKVKKKLEKLDEKNKDDDGEEVDYQSFDSYLSEKSTPSDNSLSGLPSSPSPPIDPLNITNSMSMLDDIISDSSMDSVDKIDKLEEILTSVISAHSNLSEDKTACHCQCHTVKKMVCDVECQTTHTGEIVFTKADADRNNNN